MFESQYSEEALRYENFYRLRGVRLATGLSSPSFNSVSTFELPVNTVVHHVPESELELGISPRDFFLQKNTRQVLINHVVNYTTDYGNPTKTSSSSDLLIQKYRKQAKEIRRLLSYDAPSRDSRLVVVENYALLNHLKKYRPVPLVRLNKFLNMWSTVFQNVAEVAVKLPEHHQFVRVQLPKVLPSVPLLKQASADYTKNRLEMLPDDTSLLLVELWKWLMDNSSEVLQAIPKDQLDKINLVFVEGSWYSVLNLGVLWSFRRDPDDRKSKGDFAPQELGLKFYAFLQAHFVLRSQVAKNLIVSTKDAQGQETVVITVNDSDVQTEEPVADTKTQDTVVKVVTPTTQLPVEPPNDESIPKLISKPSQSIEKLGARGLLSVPEQRRALALAESYKRIPNPRGKGTLEDAARFDPELITNFRQKKIPDSPWIFDKSFLNTTIEDFDRVAIEKVLPAQITQMVLATQNMDVLVTDYQIERHTDAYNDYEIHTVKLNPLTGSPSSVRFKLPVFNERGEYMANGVIYRLRKQRGDVPIRKVTPRRVALSSYYSKVFVNRSDKKVDDYGDWLMTSLFSRYESGELKGAKLGKPFDPELKAPRSYGALAGKFASIETPLGTILLDQKEVRTRLGDEVVDTEIKKGHFVCGVRKDGTPLLLTDVGLFHTSEGQELGWLEDTLGLDRSKAPIDVVEVSYLGKSVPMALVLGHRYGITELLKRLKVEHRFVVRGARMELQPDEYAIRFSDQSLIVSRNHQYASLILAGFNTFDKTVSQYSYSEYDKPEVYETVMYQQGLGGRYTRELPIMFDGFVDPITEDVLKRMGEPTTFEGLLDRSVELLLTDDHPNESDARYRRIKGYERVAGRVYEELVRGIKQYRTNPRTSKAKVEVNPQAVWFALQGDTSISIVEESNPIQNLKEGENITLSGTGGRMARTLLRRTREFHPTDLGIVSESTVDSSDVAVTTFASPNSRLDNLYGMTTTPVDFNDTTSLISTTALLCPSSDRDDFKRVNFSAIQQSHVIPVKAYRASPLRTGYESVIAQRVGPLFAGVAQHDGKIAEVSDRHIKVTYNDHSLEKTEVTYKLGRQYGVMTGTIIPHDLVTDFKPGDVVKAGTVVMWNAGFFERDFLNPTQVVWKMGILTWVVLWESSDTFEDSNAIAPELATALTTDTCQLRELTLSFDQTVRNLVEVGQEVGVHDVLCYIEDAITAESKLFGEDTLDTLQAFARNAPKAKTAGKVGRIEVFYNGDLEDMSESLRTLVSNADRKRARDAKLLGGNSAPTGRVPDVDLDKVLIKVYIDSELGSADGDKIVFCNQMKSVTRSVFSGKHETESGIPIGARFSYRSVNARIVESPIIQGTTNVVLKLISEKAAAAYRS